MGTVFRHLAHKRVVTMKLFLATLAAMATITMAIKNYDGYQVLRTPPLTGGAAALLRELQLTTNTVDFCREPVEGRTTDINTPPHLLNSVKEMLASKGVEVSIMIEDVEKLIQDTKPSNISTKSEGKRYAMNWDDYQRHDVLNEFIESIADANDFATINHVVIKTVVQVELGSTLNGLGVEQRQLCGVVRDDTLESVEDQSRSVIVVATVKNCVGNKGSISEGGRTFAVIVEAVQNVLWHCSGKNSFRPISNHNELGLFICTLLFHHEPDVFGHRRVDTATETTVRRQSNNKVVGCALVLLNLSGLIEGFSTETICSCWPQFPLSSGILGS